MTPDSATNRGKDTQGAGDRTPAAAVVEPAVSQPGKPSAEQPIDAAPDDPLRKFRLFSVASMIVAAAVIIGLVVLYRQASMTELVEMAEIQNVELGQSIANSLWPRFSTYIEQASEFDRKDLPSRPEIGEIGAALKALTKGLSLLMVNIHNLDGTTVYATDPSGIGRDKSQDPGFVSAAKDMKPWSMLVDLGIVDYPDGSRHQCDLVKTFVPFRRGDGPVEGVFELSTDVTTTVAGIRRLSNELLAGLLVSLGILYGVFYFMVRRASRIIGNQTLDLQRKTEALVTKDTDLGRAVGERAEIEGRLEGAIESLQEAFVFFDADDRLVFCNDEYRRMHPLGDELIHPGISFEEIIRANVERGNVVDAIGREDEHIRERMKQHRNPAGPIVRRLANGKSYVINERRTPDGGTCLTMNDVTDLKRTEEALRLSESRLRGALDSLQEGFALYDAEDRLVLVNEVYTSWNPAAREIIEKGGTFEDLVRANIKRGYLADAVGREEEFIRDRLARHRNPGIPILRQFSDGRWCIIKDSRTPEGGTAVTFSEVTELKRAEEAVVESRRALKAVIDAVPAMVNAKDVQSRFLFMNRYQADLYGVTPEDAVGKTASELVGSSYGAYTEAIDAEVIATGRAKQNYEETWVDRDGNTRVLLTTKVPLRDDDDVPSQVVTVALDITERKQAEESRRESEQRLTAILDSVPVMINVKDTDSRYLLCNRHHREFFGLGDSDVIGVTPDFISPEHGELVRKLERSVIDTGEALPFYDETLRRHDGEDRPHIMTKVPLLDLSGEVVGTVTAGIDVTRRREAEEQAEADQRRLRDAIDSIDGGVILYDADDRFVLCNSTYRENLREIEHLLVPGTPFEDVIRGVTDAGIVAGIADPEKYVRERTTRHRRLAPSIVYMKRIDRWYLLREYRTSDGGTLIIRTDITDQKRTEAALRESEERFRDLTHGSVMGVVIDRHGKPLFANQAYADIFGYDSPDDITALEKLDSLYAPDDLPKIKRHRNNRIAGKSAPDSYEFRGVRKDGAEIWLESRFRVITWERKPAIQSTVIDITERHRAEEALQQSEERLRDIAVAASDWFWEMGPDLRYTFVSERFYEETGKKPKDVIGKTRLEFIGPRLVEKDESVWKAYEDDVKNRRPFRNLEYARKEPDGEIRYKRVTGTPFFDRDGAFLGYRGTTTDITDYRRAEQELMQHKKMESLGSLAGGIAHNLNNMLQPILILNHMTRDALPEGSTERENLVIVSQACDRAKQLVDRILAFSREKTLRPEHADICEIVREGLDLVNSVVPSTVTVHEDLNKDTGTVFVDTLQTQTVVMNLIANAIDAIGTKEGKVDISLSRVRIGNASGEAVPGLEGGLYAKLTVADSGRGMDEKTLNRVFDPFFTTKELGRGTGLGLSTAFGIVNRHGGTIRAASRPGKGSTFDVYFPLDTGDEAPGAARPG